ncbi:MAG: DUF2779 domain-containing protein [Mycoplasmataceae bacterium]|nr:DUF2779 domain-containing protein [Mycoplasmataceae bacterium]
MELQKKEFITYKHLERLFTSQEYFVWNLNVDKVLSDFNIEDENTNSLWEIFDDLNNEEDLDNYKFVEIIKNGFNLVNELFIKQIKDWAIKEKKKIIIINEKNNQLAFQKTIDALNDPEIDWIVNPVFIFDDLISKCALYIKDQKKLFSLIHSSKTKLKNYIKAYFDFNVLIKNNIEINEYLFFNYDSKKEYLKSNDLSFVYSKYCWTQKSSPSKQFKKPIEEHVKYSIIEKLKTGIITFKLNKKTNEEEPIITLFLKDFDDFILQIKNAKNIPFSGNINQKDLTIWGSNPLFNDLFNYQDYGIKKVSGNLLKKSELIELFLGTKKINDFAKNKLSLNYVLTNKSQYDKEIIKSYLNKIEINNIVWYDFEGFSMPYSILAHTKPYQQLVFQLSLIRTEKEQIIFNENLVIDPQKISTNDFVNIIEKIYWSKAQYYVVYNKNYEILKLKEMIELIEKDENLSLETKKSLSNKVNLIEQNTVDLLDLFSISQSKDKIPPIFIPDLLGFSSIKKIENYINNNNIKLKVMIKPYKNLNIQNGLMAMNKGIQRYLNSIGDLEWEKESKNLAEYCENDVYAMIMVYFFVKKIYQEN